MIEGRLGAGHPPLKFSQVPVEYGKLGDLSGRRWSRNSSSRNGCHTAQKTDFETQEPPFLSKRQPTRTRSMGFWCGRRDLNPHSHSGNRFSYHFDFRRRASRVRGLDYPFTLAFAVGAARLVSTPSRQARAWLGIGTVRYHQSVPRI